jgi:RND family efflux transporter MFP subunit
MKVVDMRVWRYAVLALLTVALCSGCGDDEVQQPEVVRPVKSMLVESPSKGRTYRFPGRVEAAKEVELAFRVSGTLVELPVKEGQTVEQDQLIARLDPRDFETEVSRIESQINEAKAQLEAMQSGARSEDVRSLEAKVASAEAKATEAKLQAERKAKLYQDNVISKMEYDNAVATRDVAQANLEGARQELRKARQGARREDVQAMQARIAGLRTQYKRAMDALADSVLRAPFTGTVSRRYLENHQEISARTAVVKLQNLTDEVQIGIDVPESIIAHGERGEAELFVSFEFLPGERFPAEAVEVGTEADPATGTFPVKLVMRPRNETERFNETRRGTNILPGMTAVVEAVTYPPKQDQDAPLRVPVHAVAADAGGRPYVWVVNPKDSTVHRRPIIRGRLEGSSIEVTSGLAVGERIVTAGVDYLVEGQHVRVGE